MIQVAMLSPGLFASKTNQVFEMALWSKLVIRRPTKPRLNESRGHMCLWGGGSGYLCEFSTRFAIRTLWVFRLNVQLLYLMDFASTEEHTQEIYAAI